VLATSQDTSLFQTKYVQRFIDFHWNNGHRGILKFNFAIYCVIMALILTGSLLTKYPNGSPSAKTRRIILIVNAVLVLIYVPAYELKQLSRQKCSYFKSSKNIGDILFVLTFLATLVFDLTQGSTSEDSELYEVTRILYACLCPAGFFKLLDSMRTWNSVSFIVRMIYSVIKGLTPFLVLYFFLILVSMFAMMTLGLEFKADEEEG